MKTPVFSHPLRSLSRLALGLTALAALAPANLLAASGNWNITTGGSWNTATNWNPAAVPGTAAGDVVSLTNALTANVLVTNNTAGVIAGVLNLGGTANNFTYNLTNLTDSGFTFNNNGNGAQLNEVATSKGDTIGQSLVLADSLAITNASTNQLNLFGSISGSKAVSAVNLGAGTVNFVPTQVRTVSSSGTTTTVTMADTTGLLVGQAVSGTGIQSGSYITAINNSTTITLSGNATNLANVNATISGSTYNGGTTVNGGAVNLGVSSAYASPAIQSGPLGVGGVTFGAGTTVKNSSGVSWYTPSITLNGDIYLTGGNRLTVAVTNLNLGGSTRRMYVNSKSFVLLPTNGLSPTYWSPTNSSGTTNSENTGLSSWEMTSTFGPLTIQNGSLDLETTAYTSTNYGALLFSSSTFANFVGNGTLTVGPNVVLLYNGSSVAANAPLLSISTGGVVDGVDASNIVAGLSGGGTYVLSLVAGSTKVTPRTLLVNGTSGTASFAGSLMDGPAALLSLTKSGASTQILTGTNTYSGPTLVTGGSLLVNGTNTVYTGTGGYYYVTNSGTLGGSGLINLSAVNLGVTNSSGGKISPGAAANTTGTLTFNLGTGMLDLSGGLASAGSLVFDLAGISASDEILVSSGNVNIGSGLLNWNSFSFNPLSGLQAGTYTLLTAPNAITGSLGSPLTGVVGSYDGTLSLSGDGKSILLTLTTPSLPIPSFSNLAASQTIGYGLPALTLSGKVAASGPVYPVNGESGTVSVTINGTQTFGTFTDGSGDFSISFNTSVLPASSTAYPITYSYAGDARLGAAANNTATTLTVTTNLVWTGAAGTNFEAAGSWNPSGAPLNDLVSDLAIFSGTPAANQPSLTTSRSISGLDFTSPSGGWTLAGNNTNVLSLGAYGIVSANTSGTNIVAGTVNPQANQNWQAATGGTLLFTGSVTNPATATTNCTLSFASATATGNIILSPSAGNSLNLTGPNNNGSLFQVKSAGTLTLGGDGVTAPLTTSTNLVINTVTNSYGSLAINSPGALKVKSGYWIFGDLGKNGADRFTGYLEVDGGTLSFGGMRYMGEGTLQLNGGTLRCAEDTGTHFINGQRFSPGATYTTATNVAVVNVTGGLLDLGGSGGDVYGGNCIGSGLSTLMNQSGGLVESSVNPSLSSGPTTLFTIGGVAGASGVGNVGNNTAYTLTGGTFLSAGTINGSGTPGAGSVNNFNFMGGTLATAGFDATYLGSSPTATATANQTNVSLAIGTLANYGGVLAPGGTNVVGRTVVTGGYAVSNNAAVLALDLGGTTPATTFQTNNVGYYDTLQVIGNVSLGGSLVINLVGGYTPASTDQLNVLSSVGTGNTITGTFTNLNTAGASGNYLGRVTVANQTNASFKVIINSLNNTLYLYDYQVAGGSPGNVSYLAFNGAPVINGSTLTLSGTNSGAGSFYLLTSTNLTTPFASWTPVWTNTATGSGTFNTNLNGLVNLSVSQQFFLLSTNN